MRTHRRIRWVSFAVACVLASPLPMGIWAGLYLRMSPLLFLQSVLARVPLTPLAAFGAGTLAFILWKHHGFCRYLCPTGALCDAVSGCRKPNHAGQRLPRLHRSLALLGLGLAALGFPVLGVLDPIALFQDAWSPWSLSPPRLHSVAAWAGVAALAAVLLVSLLFPYLWCHRLCPLGGLQSLAAHLQRMLRRRPKVETGAPAKEHGWQRRPLIILGAGMAGGWLLRRIGGTRARAALRPPGSQPEARFLATCCRCGSCTRSCPAHIITPATDFVASLGLLAPRLDFSRGYCPPTCNACGQACPSGAIRPFSAADKPRLVIGTAVINLEGCLLTQNVECGRCKTACPYEAVTIAGDLFTAEPRISPDHCTGCGACAVVCPPQIISIRPPTGPQPKAPGPALSNR